MNYCYRTLTAALALGFVIAAWAAERGLAWPTAASFQTPQASGQVEFLRIHSNRRWVLAGHERDGTADFIHLEKHCFIARVKVGAAADTAAETDSKYYS